MGEQRKRPSPLGHIANRKSRAWRRGMTPNGAVVKQEVGEGREDQQEEGELREDGNDDAGALLAMEDGEEPQISLRFGLSFFHCRACNLPLKPPTFKCEAGHMVCSACRNSHGQVCGGGGAYTACADVDAFVRGATARSGFGCGSVVVYHEAADHRRACGWAPCFCPCPGCDFSHSPPRLLEHFAAAHSWPASEVSYGKPCGIPVPQLAQGWHALVGVEDRAVFLVSGGMLGAAAAVSLVCVRGNGEAPDGVTQYRCKLWAEVGSNVDNMTMMTSVVESSNLSAGFPAPDHGMFLAVPLNILYDVSGDTPILKIRIDRVSGTAASARSATPAARTLRRQQ